MKCTNRRYQQTLGKAKVYVRFKTELQTKPDKKDWKNWQKKPFLTTPEQEYFFDYMVSGRTKRMITNNLFIFRQFCDCRLFKDVRQNEMFVNYCIVNKKQYLKAKIKHHERAMNHYKGVYEQCYKKEYKNDEESDDDNACLDMVTDSSPLEIVDPHSWQDVDECGVDLRPLYASVLWYLACVRTIEALNALTIDVDTYGRKGWILRQLELIKHSVRKSYLYIQFLVFKTSHRKF